MSGLKLVEYSDSDSCEESNEEENCTATSTLAHKLEFSGKKVAVIQPTIQPNLENVEDSATSPSQAEPETPAAPPPSPVHGFSDTSVDDQELAQILSTMDNSDNLSPVRSTSVSPVEVVSSPYRNSFSPIEVTSSPDPDVPVDYINISSDSADTILYESPVSQHTIIDQSENLRDEFDDYVISDRSFTTGK